MYWRQEGASFGEDTEQRKRKIAVSSEKIMMKHSIFFKYRLVYHQTEREQNASDESPQYAGIGPGVGVIGPRQSD